MALSSFPGKRYAFILTQLILVPYFLTRCSGCNGPTSDTPNDLPKTDVTVQVVLRDLLHPSILGVLYVFHQTGAIRPELRLTISPDLIVEYARPRRDAVVVRGDSPDSADTAKSTSPRSPPTRGRYTRPLVLQEIKGALTPCPRLAPCNARLRYPIVVSNLSRRTRWQVCLNSTSPWPV
jgi:hypothetical protein